MFNDAMKNKIINEMKIKHIEDENNKNVHRKENIIKDCICIFEGDQSPSKIHMWECRSINNIKKG